MADHLGPIGDFKANIRKRNKVLKAANAAIDQPPKRKTRKLPKPGPSASSSDLNKAAIKLSSIRAARRRAARPVASKVATAKNLIRKVRARVKKFTDRTKF